MRSAPGQMRASAGQSAAHPMMPPLFSCVTQMLRSAAPFVRVRLCMSALLALKMSNGYLMCQTAN